MIFEDVKIVVLDACVLYSAPIRDLLLHLSAEKQFRVKWSKQIHTEWTRSLLKGFLIKNLFFLGT